MAMMEKITVAIDANGDAQVHPEGFDGKKCQLATAGLEKALGATQSSQPTGEMSRHPRATAKLVSR